MRILVLISTVLLLGSCTKNPTALQCDLEDGLEGSMAYTIESVLNCSGTQAVRASVNGWVDAAGVCASSSPSPVPAGMKEALSPGAVCGAIVIALGSSAGNAGTAALNSKFPGWNCDPAALVSDASQAATLLCNAIFTASASLAKHK